MGAIGSFFGLGGGGGGRKQLEQAIKGIRGVRLPTAEELQFAPEMFETPQVFTPTLRGEVPVVDSQFEGISTDPILKQAQLQALSQLQNIGSEGGLTAIDRAQLGQIQAEQQNVERGQREAILQNARQRGVSGSGLELASLLQGQQGAATRAGERGLGVAALAQQRALDAIQQAGALGGQIRGQEFGEQAQAAQAQDLLSRFNTENMINQQRENLAARNQATLGNIAARTQVGQQNVQQRNLAQQANLNVRRQAALDLLGQRQAEAGAIQDLAGQQERQAKTRRGILGGALETIGGLF